MCNDRAASNSTSLQNKYKKQSFGRVVTNGKRRWMAECVPPFARKIEHFAAARRRRHTRDGRSKTTHESTQIQTKNTFAQRNCQNHKKNAIKCACTRSTLVACTMRSQNIAKTKHTIAITIIWQENTFKLILTSMAVHNYENQNFWKILWPIPMTF